MTARQFCVQSTFNLFCTLSHPHLSYLPFCRCHNLQHPSGLMASLWTWTRMRTWTWTWTVPLSVRVRVYGRIGCQLDGQSVTQSNRTKQELRNKRRGTRIENWESSNEFVSCLPKGFSIESVKYHNLQSNPKSSAAHFSLGLFSFCFSVAKDDETTPKDTHVTTNELTMDNADNPDKQHTNRHP